MQLLDVIIRKYFPYAFLLGHCIQICCRVPCQDTFTVVGKWDAALATVYADQDKTVYTPGQTGRLKVVATLEDTSRLCLQKNKPVFTSSNPAVAAVDSDGIITDERDNAMYVSKPGLLGGSNKYQGVEHGVWRTENGSRYWVTSLPLPELQAVVYSLVYYPPNRGIWIGFLLLLIMGFIWFAMADWINLSMAEHHSKSIGALVHEIRIVQQDPAHRIELHTDDEFEEVSQQINKMLEIITELNSRNTELIQLNARIEMQQLMAQMNPHFLYNTLEIIRSFLSFDPDTSEQLIVSLTEILRYSVDASRQEVRLAEDMEYINKYLNIQRCRFGDRFHCEINLSEACDQCLVPKLLIQPLIENSIKYGFRKKMDICIRVEGHVEHGILCIRVSDDGLGMDEEEAKTLQQRLLTFDNSARSIGLRNLSRRLYLKYGSRSGLQIRNTPGVGFAVDVHIEQTADRNAKEAEHV